MWKAALVMLIAFVAFVGTTLEWGQTLDGRNDDPCRIQGVDTCDADPVTTTSSTTSTSTTTTAPGATTAPGPTTTP